MNAIFFMKQNILLVSVSVQQARGSIVQATKTYLTFYNLWLCPLTIYYFAHCYFTIGFTQQKENLC